MNHSSSKRSESIKEKRYEEYAYVLDYLGEGHLDVQKQSYSKEPVVQALGTELFTLLELVPKKGARIVIHERLYIGVKEREKIDHVKRRVDYERLSATAKAELPYAIEKVIEDNSRRFLRFFNRAHPLTTRMHQLELLPGIGKKIMWETLEERKKGPFKSFQDLGERTRIPDPKKTIIKRVMAELKGEDKYRIFTRKP
ncbi:MAG: DUF655 domain-containing protein [Promethearchaeota archaeon]